LLLSAEHRHRTGEGVQPQCEGGNPHEEDDLGLGSAGRRRAPARGAGRHAALPKLDGVHEDPLVQAAAAAKKKNKAIKKKKKKKYAKKARKKKSIKKKKVA
jgi:hypothetical protein